MYLSALALENRIPVALTLGIYAMHDGNTPGVGEVLADRGLPYIPEAHCYLVHGGQRVDVTRTGSEPAEAIDGFMHEEVITPEQIGDYKVELHKRWIREWVETKAGGAGQWSFDAVWSAREACIQALAQ